MKKLACADIIQDAKNPCDFIAVGKTDEEVTDAFVDHVAEMHPEKVERFTKPEAMERVAEMIIDDDVR